LYLLDFNFEFGDSFEVVMQKFGEKFQPTDFPFGGVDVGAHEQMIYQQIDFCQTLYLSFVNGED